MNTGKLSLLVFTPSVNNRVRNISSIQCTCLNNDLAKGLVQLLGTVVPLSYNPLF